MARLLPDGRRVVVSDAIVALWTIAWVVVAIEVAVQVGALASVGDTAIKSGHAVEAAGALLGQLVNLPFVGGQIGQAAQSVQAAGASAVASGQAARASALPALLGVGVGLIPTGPVLALYLVARVGRAREAAAVRADLRARWADRGFQRHLARRALANVPYRELRRAIPEPWNEIEAGRYTHLATLELARLGLARPRVDGGQAPSGTPHRSA